MFSRKNICIFDGTYNSMKKMKSESVSCSVMSDSLQTMDCNLPSSSVHGIFQARTLEWVAIPFSRGCSRPGIEPGSPALQADSLPFKPPGKPI